MDFFPIIYAWLFEKCSYLLFTNTQTRNVIIPFSQAQTSVYYFNTWQLLSCASVCFCLFHLFPTLPAFSTLSSIATISIVKISKYFWLQSWSLIADCLSMFPPLPSETMTDYTCMEHSDAFLHTQWGRRISALLYIQESVSLIVFKTLSSLYPRSPVQLVRCVPPSSCSLSREEFKGKVSNSVLRWTSRYFFLSFKAAELFPLASSQRNQTEELHITLKSLASSGKILNVTWILNSV